MPIVVAILVAAVIAIILVRTGMVSAGLLFALAYGVGGGVLGFMILRFIVGPLGPVGAGVGAVIGAVILLFLAQRFSSKD